MRNRGKELSQSRILGHPLAVAAAVDDQNTKSGKIRLSGHLGNMTDYTQGCAAGTYPLPLRVGNHGEMRSQRKISRRFPLLQLRAEALRLLLIGSGEDNIIPMWKVPPYKAAAVIIPAVAIGLGQI